MSHRIRERSLEQALGSHPFEQRRAALDVATKICDHAVKAFEFLAERRQIGWPERTPDEVRASVAKHAGHVTNNLGRGADIVCGAERAKVGRSSSQGLLRPVGECGKKVVQQQPFLIHRDVRSLRRH